ncbi:hypothetical protein BDV93DRAFT_606335 [Ceratobasidium sp. AG-I]|nr:hypothetical protein BDV93DRAFT_606335 [Ceratobasidium sp. AG-I]
MAIPPTLKSLLGINSIGFADEGSDEETQKVDNTNNEGGEDQGQGESMGQRGGDTQHPAPNGQPPNGNKEENFQQDLVGSNSGGEAVERHSCKPLSSVHGEFASSPSTGSAYGVLTASDASSAISSCHLLAIPVAISDIVGVPSSNTPKNTVSPELGRAAHGARSQAGK